MNRTVAFFAYGALALSLALGFIVTTLQPDTMMQLAGTSSQIEARIE